jgi:septum formation protein
MINQLCGRSHSVLTGLALLGPGGKIIGRHVEKSIVTFQKVALDRIRQYAQTIEPYDKAGSYDIQGSAGRWIFSLDGDYFNVMGLPVGWLFPLLSRHVPIQSENF